MLMRITWGKIRPGFWDDFEAEFLRNADPATEGLLGNWLTRDVRDGDSLYTVTLWRDAEAIRAWEASPSRDARAKKLSKYLIGEYSVSVCEVSYAAAIPNLPRVPEGGGS
jgi:heme-degrading monooxygenase HmoA